MQWLSTRCNPLCWLPAFLSFFCFSSDLLASTAATVAYRSGTTQASSGAAVCTALGKTNYTSIGTYTVGSGPFNAGDVYIYQFIGGDFGRCGSYPGDTSGAQVYQYDICPVAGGYTMISGRMACGTGPIESCPAANTLGSSFIGFSATGDFRSNFSGSTCHDTGSGKCAATCGDTVIAYSDLTNTSSVTCSTYRYTGASCTGTDSALSTTQTGLTSGSTATPINNPPKSSADCPGGSGFAQINNTTMCLPSGTQYTSGSSTISMSGGGSTTVTNTTQINRDGTNTTTTTTTNKDGSGAVIGSYTGTTTGSVNQADGTSGNDKPLNLGPAPAFDGTLPNDPTFNIKTITNPTLSTSLFGVSASCPEPLTFEAMGRSFEITFQPICDLADIIRGIILMLSAIVAIRAVVTK